jgi:hypothetical protein
LRVRAITFVMKVGELDKAMGRLVREPKVFGFNPARLDPTGVAENHRGAQEKRAKNETAAAEFPWLQFFHSGNRV